MAIRCKTPGIRKFAKSKLKLSSFPLLLTIKPRKKVFANLFKFFLFVDFSFKAIEIPFRKRKKGIIRSARVIPSQGEC